MKLKLDSRREDVDQLLCCHSKTASVLLPNWQEVWNIEVPRFVTAFQPKINQEFNYHKFQDRTKDETLLVGVWVDNSPHLMLTVTKRQSTPFCSTCDSLTCPHYKFYRSRQKDENNILVSNFNSSIGVNENGNNSINIEVAIDADENAPDDIIDPEVGEEETPARHYLDLPPPAQYRKMYGHNRKKILYPFERCKEQQQTWLKRTKDVYDFPSSFVPVWSAEEECSHGFQYDCNDANLVLESATILVYNNIGEKVYNVKNYARKSLHSCKELMRFDANGQFLWNLGGGRFVNYTLLSQYLHLFYNSGLSINAMHKSILEMSSNAGLSSSLTYHDFHRAVTGFFVCLSFDEKVAFRCPTHGNSPVWINTDGKCTGPAKRRVQHIEELDHHQEDL